MEFGTWNLDKNVIPLLIFKPISLRRVPSGELCELGVLAIKKVSDFVPTLKQKELQSNTANKKCQRHHSNMPF